ncbi:MAG: TraR/DksA family transcriptional regulator, partial [Lewinella sp.]|nr:TraR/DksA family transcriptional regulator [Lewinella sp.]
MDGKEGVVRYSDSDLAEFKAVIEKKMALAKEQLDSLQEQIMEISENIGDEHGGDWVDDSSNNSDVEMLNNMAIRQRKFIQDLDNALVRIRNKVYGICVVTGELIDKRRLLAVPTTTKSLSAKTDARKLDEERMITGPTKTPYVKGNDDDEEEEEAAKKKKKPTKPKIISKIIRKPSATPAQSRPPIDEDDEDEDDNL